MNFNSPSVPSCMHTILPYPPTQQIQQEQPVSSESLEGEYLKKHSIRSREKRGGEIRGGGIFNRALWWSLKPSWLTFERTMLLAWSHPLPLSPSPLSLNPTAGTPTMFCPPGLKFGRYVLKGVMGAWKKGQRTCGSATIWGIISTSVSLIHLSFSNGM